MFWIWYFTLVRILNFWCYVVHTICSCLVFEVQLMNFQDHCFVILLKWIMKVVRCKETINLKCFLGKGRQIKLHDIIRYMPSWADFIRWRLRTELFSFLIYRSRQNKKEMLKSVDFEVEEKTCLDKANHLHVFSWMHYLKP